MVQQFGCNDGSGLDLISRRFIACVLVLAVPGNFFFLLCLFAFWVHVKVRELLKSAKLYHTLMRCPPTRSFDVVIVGPCLMQIIVKNNLLINSMTVSFF